MIIYVMNINNKLVGFFLFVLLFVSTSNRLFGGILDENYDLFSINFTEVEIKDSLPVDTNVLLVTRKVFFQKRIFEVNFSVVDRKEDRMQESGFIDFSSRAWYKTPSKELLNSVKD